MTVSIKDFCAKEEFLNLSLYPKQEESLSAFFDPEKDYREAVFLIGKGAGKDLMATCILAYQIYLLEEMPDPQGYLGLAPGDPIDNINVATTLDQATTVFLSRFKARLDSSEYFQSLGYRPYSDRVIFPNNIVAYATHARSEVYEGKNVYTAILDEASGFASSGAFGDADKVYNTLMTSMLSRFPKHGKMCTLSYPRSSTNDFTVELYKKKVSSENTLCIKGSTYEFNIKNTPELMKTFYEHDEAKAKLMFEVDLTVNSNECWPKELLEDTAYKAKPLILSKADIKIAANGRRYNIREIISDIEHYPHQFYIGIDTTVRGSAMSMTIGHIENTNIRIDQVIQWQPYAGYEVDFANVQDMIMKFGEKNVIREIWLDQFNAAYLEQLLIANGYDANKINFNKRPMLYEAVNVMLRFGSLFLPQDIVEEMKFPKKTGEKSITDVTDLTDSTALCVWRMYEILRESLQDKPADDKEKPLVVYG